MGVGCKNGCDDCDGSCKKPTTKCPKCGKLAQLYKYHGRYSLCFNCCCEAEIEYSHTHPCTHYDPVTEPTPRKNDR